MAVLTDEEISMVLNTYMYLNHREPEDGRTLGDIMNEMSTLPECMEGGAHYGEYCVVSKAAENREISSLVLSNQSYLMGFDDGTAACTFTSQKGDVYVVYRGTGDGEWPDNGLGMTSEKTLQQERALSYFETVAGKEGYTSSQKVIITGHSKGGNKAQYVTMTTQYDDLVDQCYNIDGQGFSQKAISRFRKNLGEEGFEQRRSKITGIYGENDYINVLGNSIVKENQVHYVETPAVAGFAGYHDIKYLFAGWENGADGATTSIGFRGTKNSYVASQGLLGSYAATLSAAVMSLPTFLRDGCAAVLMQVMELGGKKKVGQNGEFLTKADLQDFFGVGLPVIAGSVLLTKEGRELIARSLSGDSYACDMDGKLHIGMQTSVFEQEDVLLDELGQRLSAHIEKERELYEELPLIVKAADLFGFQVPQLLNGMEETQKKLTALRDDLQQVQALYQKADREMAALAV